MSAPKCKCHLCKRGRRIDKIVKGRSLNDMRHLIIELEDNLLNTEFELEAEKLTHFDPSGGER